jgi:PQQ system protein
MIWDPSILVMPHGGELELELINDDQNTHCALLPSNGDNQFLWLPNHSEGWPASSSTAPAVTGSARSSATMKATG